MLAIGARDRVAGLVLAAWLLVIAWSWPSSFMGIVLVLHAALPPAPYGSWEARGRPDPAGDWEMPDWLPLEPAYRACFARFLHLATIVRRHLQSLGGSPFPWGSGSWAVLDSRVDPYFHSVVGGDGFDTIARESDLVLRLRQAGRTLPYPWEHLFDGDLEEMRSILGGHRTRYPEPLSSQGYSALNGWPP